jgi:transcriptional regulator with XRE-family HTH domain
VDLRERRELGRLIKHGRQRLMLTQQELAERVGVEPNSVYRWEAGIHAPRPDDLRGLRTELGVELPSGTPSAPDDPSRPDFLAAVATIGLSGLTSYDPAWSLADLERVRHSIQHQKVDEELVQNHEAMLEQHSRMYFKLGSLQMLEYVGAFVRSALLLEHGEMTDDLRRRLAAVITEDAGRAAWLAYDVGNTQVSESFYAIADEAASRTEPHEGAYVKAYKGIIRVQRGSVREALALSEDAIERGRTAAPDMRAWIFAQAAMAAAHAQDRSRAEASLRRAHADLDVAVGDPDHRLFWLDPWRLSALEGAVFERLGDGLEAERRIQPAMSHLPRRSPRGRSEMLLDIAGIALLRGEVDQAIELTHESLRNARAAQSTAGVDRVRQFRLRLHNRGDRRALALLDEDLVGAA